jgi:thiamine biosynthesis lipoprotein
MADSLNVAQLNSVQGFFFDTLNSISALADKVVLKQALQLCSFYNDLLSKTVAGSDVWRINHAGGQPLTVSEHTARLLEVALELGKASGGALNIALEPLIALWNVGAENPRIPTDAEINQALAATDFSSIELDGCTVRAPQGMRIDLGGIAKGYICDRIADSLRQQDVECALLNFGGNVVTVGTRPDGKPWRVGLQLPEGETGADFFAVVESVNGTVVTSGVYERGFDRGGRRYHHLLDPRSGYPVDNGVLSVTAVGGKQQLNACLPDCQPICPESKRRQMALADVTSFAANAKSGQIGREAACNDAVAASQDSLLADALTTAMFVLGKDEGQRLAARYGYQSVFRMADGSVSASRDLPIIIVK